ncbi:HAMP domain-containing sensor histidine kinase [Rhodococcus gannanensis]|uniref:histidine kinase n=1 Tax=Rhodococcus gannanensis TaxID=1960308 RepID=A0ABW4NX19_9NOCA
MAAAAALGATIVVALLGIFISVAISWNNMSQLDRRLDTAAQVLIANAAEAASFLPRFGDTNAFAITIRNSNTGDVMVSTPTTMPVVGLGAETATVDGTDYRVSTTAIPNTPLWMSLAVPASEADDITTDQRKWVMIAGLIAVAGATGLGWLFGGRAVRPIVQLTHQIADGTPQAVTVSGVREAEELADAIDSMLDRITDAQRQTEAALDTARDFAAASAHELRTPLTAMRTDIEVLSTLELDSAERAEILIDLARTQGRVESTLAALERLASGELSSDKDHAPTDLVEICDAATRDAQRQHPNLTVQVDADRAVVVSGLSVGLRLAVDNAISNAVRHGRAGTVRLAVHRQPGGTVRLTVDDDGRGIPEAEREVVFERFQRGAGAAAGGSGLGLALVDQQAQLHGGRAWFEESDLGGARLVFEFPSRP